KILDCHTAILIICQQITQLSHIDFLLGPHFHDDTTGEINPKIQPPRYQKKYGHHGDKRAKPKGNVAFTYKIDLRVYWNQTKRKLHHLLELFFHQPIILYLNKKCKNLFL